MSRVQRKPLCLSVSLALLAAGLLAPAVQAQDSKLAEAAYRFNRRFRLRAMLPRRARAMMLCKPCREPTLRLASNSHG